MRQHYLLIILAVAAACVLVVAVLVLGPKGDGQRQHQGTPAVNSQKQSRSTEASSRPGPQPTQPVDGLAPAARVDLGDVNGMVAALRGIHRSAPEGAGAFAPAILQVVNRYLPADTRIDLGSERKGDPARRGPLWPESILVLVDACGSVIRQAREPDDPAALLAQDVLLVTARDCSSSTGRVWASRALARFAMLDPEGKRVFSVPTEAATHAIGQSIQFALDAASAGGKDAKTALFLIRTHGMLHTWLAMRASEQPAEAKQVLKREIDTIRKTLSERLTAVSDDAVRKILEGLQQDMHRIAMSAANYAATADRQERLRKCVDGFLTEVNREDKSAASKYLTFKSAAALSKITSMRSAIAGTSRPKEVRLHKIGPLCRVGDRTEVALYVDIVDQDDAVIRKMITLSVVQTGDGFRIGEK